MNASTRMPAVAATLVVIALALALPGCSGDEDLDSAPTPGETEAPAPVAKEAPAAASQPSRDALPPKRRQAPMPEVTDRVSVSEQLRATIDLPEFYPEDGPVYPGAKPSQAQQQPNGKVSLMFGTDAQAEEASRVMIEASEAKGWQVVSTDEFDGGILTRAQKDGRNLMILSSRLTEGDGDEITLVAVNVEP